jgi:putative serine protease PepD
VRTPTGSGTGFLVNSSGTIVTNAHVVGDNKQVQVRFNDKGALHDAQVLSVDASTDLAAVKVDAGAAQGVRPLQLADSDKVQVGDSAIAIGYPLGLDRTATAGIISGLERQIQAPNGFSIDKVIQTDAPINPGNSGGPLLNARGEVIGINSQIATAGSRGSVGIGFAVPINTAKRVRAASASASRSPPTRSRTFSRRSRTARRHSTPTSGSRRPTRRPATARRSPRRRPAGPPTAPACRRATS